MDKQKISLVQMRRPTSKMKQTSKLNKPELTETDLTAIAIMAPVVSELYHNFIGFD